MNRISQTLCKVCPGRSGQQTDHDRFQYAGSPGNGGNSGRDRAKEIRAVESVVCEMLFKIGNEYI